MSDLWPARVELDQWRAIIWICVLAIFMLMVNFWFFITSYTVQRYEARGEIHSIAIFVSAPKYLSADEDEEINFAFRNGPDYKIDVLFQLNDDGVPSDLVLMAENNKLYEGTVNKREQIYHQSKVRYASHLARNHLTQNHPINMSLWGSTDNAPERKVFDLDVRLAPIPRARWLSGLLGTALVAIMIVLCHDSWKQLNGADKKE